MASSTAEITADMKKMATDVGAKSIDKCVDDKTYRPYVKYTTQEAAAIGVDDDTSRHPRSPAWARG